MCPNDEDAPDDSGANGAAHTNTAAGQVPVEGAPRVHATDSDGWNDLAPMEAVCILVQQRTPHMAMVGARGTSKQRQQLQQTNDGERNPM